MNNCIQNIFLSIENWVFKKSILDKPSIASIDDANTFYNFIKSNYMHIKNRDCNFNYESIIFSWIIQKNKGVKPKNLNINDIFDIYTEMEGKIMYNLFFEDNKYDYLSYNSDFFEYKKNIKKSNI